MGPGPSEINPRVMAAMSLPAIGYLDPVFVEMMEELKSLLRYAYQTKNALTFPVSGPGSVGMETCFVNLVAPGDKVIVCRNGVFGGRMIENVERAGGTAIVVEDAWGEQVDPQKLEDALKKNPDATVVAFVHAETSTGVQSDAKALVRASRTSTTRSPSSMPSPRSAARRCWSMNGTSTRFTPPARSACRARRACRPCPSAIAWSSTSRRARTRSIPGSWT